MTLPRRIPKPAKRASRWKSIAHRDWIRGFVCCTCASPVGIEVAHVRLGSGAGMGQKPDDWRTVPLCRDCHQNQHTMGEETFWKGRYVEELIDQFCKASPRAAQIREARNG